MKVKQLLTHLWYGASTIKSVEIYRAHTLLVELGKDRLAARDYGGFDSEPITVFLIAGDTLKLWLKNCN